MVNKKELLKKISYYKDKRKSLVHQFTEIDKRYRSGLIDLQLYYETILRNFGGDPREIIEGYDKHIAFYTNQLEKINTKRIFILVISSLFIIALFAASNQFTGLLVETLEEPPQDPSESQALPSAPEEQAPEEEAETPEQETEPEEESEIPEEEITIPKETIPIQDPTLVIEEEHDRPIVGQPVKWTKRIRKEKEGRDEIQLPNEAENIIIIKEDPEGRRRIGITGQLSIDIETAQTPRPGILKRFLSAVKRWFSKTTLTGRIAEEIELQEEEGKKKIILEEPGEYEIIYYTSAPKIDEEELSPYKKRVRVNGPDFYTDILTFITIPEIVHVNEQEGIKLFWIEGNQHLPFQAEDTNGNNRVDRITWSTPHFSNQTFEISITILNVQSYPVVGGNWVVEFTTTGIANLTIKPAEETTWSLDETKDLKFLEVKCGNNPHAYEWINNTVQITDYTCEETGSETSLVLTEGKHALEFDYGGIKKYAHNFAVGRRTGMLAYGEGTVTIPRYRIWNGTAFGSELSANSVGGVTEWLRLKASPIKDEYLLLTADTGDDINIQINSSLNGVSCWHDGTTCGSVFELETTSSAVNRLKADIAYEQLSGDAIVVFSDNTNIPKYRTWNRTAWSPEASVPQTLLPGTATYIKMVSKPGSDEIALLMTNTNNLNTLIWNGTAWTCEPPALLSTVLTPEIFQYADIAYEQVSGDLFIASSVNGITEIDFTQKPNGACSYTTTRTTTLAEEGEAISVSPQLGSDFIMIAQHSIGGNDMHAIIWNGSAMQATSGNELSLYAEASPNQLIAAGWAGASKRGILAYSDASTSLNLDYMLYNTTENAWEGSTSGLDATGITSFSDEEEVLQSYSFYEENKLLVIVRDELDDLWAKIYNADTNSWSDADAGTALETSTSSPEFPSFDFTWTFFEINEPPNITFYSPSLQNVDLLENSTRNVSVTFLATDPNGAQNINETTAFVEFTKTGEATRTSIPGSCTKTPVNEVSANITCIVPMEFYDAAGTWSLRASINDSLLSNEETSTFTVNELNSIAILSPSSGLSFPSMDPESANLTSTNDPLIIKNIGNREGPLAITGYNLHGALIPENQIPANDFSAAPIVGSECNGISLANATEVTITGSTLPRGPSSTEEIFFCLTQVPSVIAQDYSTSAPGASPWTIRILLVSLLPARKLRKRKAIEKIAQSVEKIEALSKEHHINIQDIINYANLQRRDPREIQVPLSIFSKELGILEALCKYLKDVCRMRYTDIAKILERDQRTIWISYHQAVKKETKQVKEITATIPLIELQQKNLSILESVVFYLRKKNYRYSEIASLLDRDERNIWAAAKRAEKKQHNKQR